MLESKREAKTPGGSDERTLRGLFVNPGSQVRYSFLFMGGSMLILTMFIGVVTFSVHRTVETLQEAYGIDDVVATNLTSNLTSTLTVTFIFAAVLSVFAFVLGIQLSHRLFGPLVPIQRHILALKNGDYASRIHLRRGDELQELQISLNELAQVMEAKSKS